MAAKKSKSKVGGILGKLLSRFRKGRAKPGGLSGTFILGGLLAIITAVYSIKLAIARQKIAKLRHKIDVQKEKEQHNKIIKQEAERVELRKKIGEQIREGKERAKELRAEIASSKEEVKVFESALKEAKSWSDLKIKVAK